MVDLASSRVLAAASFSRLLSFPQSSRDRDDLFASLNGGYVPLSSTFLSRPSSICLLSGPAAEIERHPTGAQPHARRASPVTRTAIRLALTDHSRMRGSHPLGAQARHVTPQPSTADSETDVRPILYLRSGVTENGCACGLRSSAEPWY